MAFYNQSQGYLRNTITEVRLLLDSPTARTKYTDSNLLDKITEAFGEITRDLYNNAQKKPLSYVDIAFVEGTEYYAIPPTVSEIRRIVQFYDDGVRIKDEFNPRHFYSIFGPGMMLDSNHRIWIPGKDVTGTFRLYYYPSGDFIPHVGRIDKATGSTSGFTMKTASPSMILGDMDRRPNAYIGSLIRILQHESAGQIPAGYSFYPIQERPVQTFNNLTGALTVKPDLDFDLSTLSDVGSLYSVYEVVPLDSGFMWPFVARYVARTLCLVEGKTRQATGLQRLQDEAKRSLYLSWANAWTRTPDVFETETVDDYQHMAIL